MNPDMTWMLIQSEHRARVEYAEKYGHHYAELSRKSRRSQRAWALPRIRRRQRGVVRPAVGP